MTKNTAKFVGNIPENYDQGLGPHIFIDYAQDLAKRAAHLKPARVLELAAGTGIVSRELRNALPAKTELIISDLNPPMLEIAKLKFADDESVSFEQVDAMDTGFPDDHFEMIVCQFGTMFFPNKSAAFAEAKRVLKPGGSYIFNTWGAMTENPFSQIAQNVSEQFFPKNAPPAFYHVPFSYGDPDEVIEDMRRGGFDTINHEIVDIQKTVSDFGLFARGLVLGNPLIDEIRNLQNVSETDVIAALESELRAAFHDGTMPLRAFIFEGKIE